MDDAPAAAILRKVARVTVTEADAARQKAQQSPTEANIRAAFFACILAARALRRASMKHPDEETAMIERSILMDEYAFGLRVQLGGILGARSPTLS